MNMKLILFLSFAAFWISCQEDENIVPKSETISSERVLLIEDFTGVKCPNCPNATRDIAALQSKYPDNVVAIAYHTNFLGSPITKEGYESKYDFRTAAGQELENSMGSYEGKPALTLNRQKPDVTSEYMLNVSSLTLSKVESELLTIPKALVKITNEYDPNSRALTSTVRVTPKENYSGDIRLHVALIESGIIDSQEDNLEYIKDYEHNHVFRAILSKLEGDELTNAMTNGKELVKTYQFTLPEEDGWWVAENCSIVAFISDYNRKTFQVGYVLQAAEAHVTE